MDDGSYTSVDVYYNEIICCNVTNLNRIGGQCDCHVTDPLLFDPDGIVDIRVFARNSVSNKTLNFTLEILKVIQNPVISMLTSFSFFGSGVKGQGELANIFPAEYPVKLNASYKNGPATSVLWNFDCETSGQSDASHYQLEKSFPGDVNQRCDITVTLKNSISTVHAYGSIILKQSMIFTSLSNDGPVKLNKTITLTILFEKFAPETCMWIDVGDNSSLLVYGDASCQTKFVVADINPNIAATPLLKFFPRSPNTQEVIVEHIYPNIGSFRVRVSASNNISAVAEETVAVILALECKNPNITITGLAPNSSNILNATQVYRSVSISLSPELQLDCEKTEATKVTWTVFDFVDDPRIHLG
ncbi:uncharacterized protein LOC114522765 [Dendronephthya gigantea]|uniref:uncharacterized protein LOC114522765 n=1 Tax=Dendronephthya gigantea TaxID=151771 RepID=UPI00106CC072|nr:uncharacterized protein LOC114522765 [Dendronephthya gigantea]